MSRSHTLQTMTITYADGTSLRAIVLLHGDNEIRATAAGYDDTLAFHRNEAAWISDHLEPVVLTFDGKDDRVVQVFPDTIMCAPRTGHFI